MAQHWLETPAARDLPLASVLRMSEDQAYAWFYRARWGRGEPVCPFCGVVDAYRLTRNGKRQNRFKCSDGDCGREFTVTSETIFAFHKLSFRKMLTVMALFVHSVKGKAAMQVCREVGISYKSAWVLLMKLREALADAEPPEPLQGIVEMDGAYMNGHVRWANRVANRVDRRLPVNLDPAEPQVIIAARQRTLNGLLRDRVFATITPGELPAYAEDIAQRKVSPDALIITDEHGAYANLDLAGRRGIRIRHAEAYAAGEGLNTNHIESFFVRVRRSVKGIHHRVTGFYLQLYVAALAWPGRRMLGQGVSQTSCGSCWKQESITGSAASFAAIGRGRLSMSRFSGSWRCQPNTGWRCQRQRHPPVEWHAPLPPPATQVAGVPCCLTPREPFGHPQGCSLAPCPSSGPSPARQRLG